MNSKCSPLLLSIVFLVLLAHTPLVAQTGTSRITGTVVDPTGAVVPGAVITATNENTGVQYRAITTSTGSYALESLPVGSYKLTVEAPGFRTYTTVGNILTVSAPLVIDITMEVGQPAEVIKVVGTYQKIETSHAMVSDVVERRAVVDLPLNGRNPLTLITLQPGLVQRTTGAAGSGIHVNGSRDRAFNVTIDGIDANEPSVPNPLNNVYRLNPDNVQEFRVVTHNPTPEFGRNSGAQVSIATRSGTNEIHGTAYEFFRNTALNANEFFNNALGVDKPDLKLNQFGIEGGGPIKKNQTFFFGSWQGQRVVLTQPISSSFGIPILYTPSARAGIFRYFIADPRNPFILDGQRITANSPVLVDPKTGQLRPEVPLCSSAVTTNCVATFNITANDPLGLGLDPKIKAFLDKYPLPNTFSVGDGLNTAGFVWNPPSRTVGPHFLFRVDHNFNENNSIFARYIHSDNDTKDGDLLNARPKVFPNFPPLGEVFRSSKNLAINYRRVFSPNVINEFTTGFARFSFFFTFGESNPDFPNIEPYEFNNISEPVLNIPHTQRALNTIQFVDNLSIVRRSHIIRAGFNIRLLQHNDSRGLAGGFNLAPEINFDQSIRPPQGFNTPPVASGTRAGINPTDNTRLLNAINELLGIPALITQGFIGDLNQDMFLGFGGLFSLGYRYKQFNFYIQDEWQVRPNLTLNYGLRYELNLAPGEAEDRVFVPDKAIEIDGAQGPIRFVRSDRWYRNATKKAFAPRFALAWQPVKGGKTVVRVGYGMAFDPISTFQITAIAGKIPGLVTQCRNVVGAAPAAGCAPVPDIRIGQGFPQQLPAPSIKPSSFLDLPTQPLGAAFNGGAFDPDLKLPTVHEWSLTIQRELPLGFVGQVGYIGKRGTRLLRAYNLNQIDISPILSDFLIAQNNLRQGCNPDGTGCPAGVAGTRPALLLQLSSASFLNSSASRTDLLRNAVGNLATRIDRTFDIVSRGFPANLFRPLPQFNQFFYIDSGGDSYYHSMQVQLRRRLSTGLEFGLAYTLGKSIDNQSVDPVGAASGGGLSTTNSRTPTDIRNWRLDRSRSDFDNRHVLVIHSVYDLPFGKGRHFGSNMRGLFNHIAGGWTLTSIFNFQSGEPFTVNSGALTIHNAKQSRALLIGPQPETKIQEASGVVGPVVFNAGPLDPATNCRQVGGDSFLCIPPPGHPGGGRNAFQGPGYWNLDLALMKHFELTERFKLQFRAEFFNALNHTNFENPRNASEGSPTLTSSLFGRSCCIAASTPSSATIIAVGEPQRVIQFALKLMF